MLYKLFIEYIIKEATELAEIPLITLVPKNNFWLSLSVAESQYIRLVTQSCI